MTLTAKDKEILIEVRIECRKMADIARRKQLPPSTIRARYRRATIKANKIKRDEISIKK